jgi:hypothetical protein
MSLLDAVLILFILACAAGLVLILAPLSLLLRVSPARGR